MLGTIDQPGAYSSLAISPDGTRAAFSRADRQGNIDLWVHEFARGSSTRLTSDSDVDYAAAWSPDGNRIAWSSRRDGTFNVYQKPSNGTGNDEVLFKSDASKFVHDWSPDGRWLLFSSGVVPRVRLFVLPVAGDDPLPQAYAQTGFSESQGRFSPNGRFVAYTSDNTGRPEIYVQPFPTASGGRWKVSEGGGAQPQWRPDGKELFYISADSKLMAVETSISGTFVPGRPTVLFEVPIMGGGQTLILNRYGSIRDGQRFLINTLLSSTGTATPITVVLNWQSALSARENR